MSHPKCWNDCREFAKPVPVFGSAQNDHSIVVLRRACIDKISPGRYECHSIPSGARRRFPSNTASTGDALELSAVLFETHASTDRREMPIQVTQRDGGT
jgi:hypothetical protein